MPLNYFLKFPNNFALIYNRLDFPQTLAQKSTFHANIIGQTKMD